MITRVLFVDSDAEALARIKQALEQAGDYEAKVFVTGQAALEYAAHNPPAVAVISLNVQDIRPDALAHRLRQIQPAVPIVLRAPQPGSDPAMLPPEPSLLANINPLGTLEGGYTTRMLVPLVEQALQPPPPPAPDNAPVDDGDTKDVPTVDSDAVRQYLATAQPDDDVAAFGEVLEAIEPGARPRNDDTFQSLVDSLRTPTEDVPLHQRQSRLVGWVDRTQDDLATDPPEGATAPQEDALFARLAAEEPPLPDATEGGTISDVIAITDPEFHETPSPDGVDVPDELIEAEENLLLSDDERSLLDALTAFANSLEADNDALEAVAAALENTGTTTLDDTSDTARVALELTQRTLNSSAQATFLLHEAKVIAAAGALPRADIEALAGLIDTEAVLSAASTRMKFAALPQTSTNYMLIAAPTVDEMVLAMVFTEDLHLSTVRQQFRVLAEALTPLLAAVDATPAELARPDTLPDDSAIFETPAPDPSQPVERIMAEGDDHAHGLTGTLDSEGEDAHALPTEIGEGQAIEAREATESAPAVEPATLVKYACAWILRDPDAELDDNLVAALPGWLEALITERHWLVDHITVEPDYVSLVLSLAPADAPAEVIETLMTASAARVLDARPGIAVSPEQLWSEAYYVVAPGRPLTVEEISRFISYQRTN